MHYWWVCRKLKLYFFSSTTANHKWPVNLSIIIDDHTKERVELYSVKKLSLRQSELRASRNHESSYQLCVACKCKWIWPIPRQVFGAGKFIDHRLVFRTCCWLQMKLWKVVGCCRFYDVMIFRVSNYFLIIENKFSVVCYYLDACCECEFPRLLSHI